MMELVALAKETLQNAVERVASYPFGQSALRYLDRSLWVVEKCARWAVPPPLDQDERPQPELVRPLPWVFFLMMLVALRITRETISLLNLVMGKPPLRSADVVMYIQSKRRYLRTLKYHGARVMRARGPAGMGAGGRERWLPALRSLLQFTMCFRRHPSYANNNSTSVSNNDQVLVVKRSKRGRECSSPVMSGGEASMERLIEKMMVDLDADSDEDSSFTLTTLTSPKSDRSDYTVESDQETFQNGTQSIQDDPIKPQDGPTAQNNTEHTQELPTTRNEVQEPVDNSKEIKSSPDKKPELNKAEVTPAPEQKGESESHTAPQANENNEIPKENFTSPQTCVSTKEETQKFIQMEAASKIPRTPTSEQKVANGRTVKSSPNKKRGAHMQEKDRRHSETRGGKTVAANNSV